MLHTSFGSTSRWRFIRKHLLMLLMAFGWFFVNGQMAVASHSCPVDMFSGSMGAAHSGAMQMHDDVLQAEVSGPLCEKHCVPDVMQKDSGHSSPVALPAENVLALIAPECSAVVEPAAYVSPPATGPPATLRFCRFRE